MSQLAALAVSLGLLGAVATYVFAVLGLFLWAGFIAWAVFLHSGGDQTAAKTTMAGGVLGAVCAWVAALAIVTIPMPDNLQTLRTCVVTGLTVMPLVFASSFKPFSVIPASVCGYAATFAYLRQTQGALTTPNLTHLGRSNALISVVVSLILGTLFGMACNKLAGALRKS